jgi:hypothetical protein
MAEEEPSLFPIGSQDITCVLSRLATHFCIAIRFGVNVKKKKFKYEQFLHLINKYSVICTTMCRVSSGKIKKGRTHNNKENKKMRKTVNIKIYSRNYNIQKMITKSFSDNILQLFFMYYFVKIFKCRKNKPNGMDSQQIASVTFTYFGTGNGKTKAAEKISTWSS